MTSIKPGQQVPLGDNQRTRRWLGEGILRISADSLQPFVRVATTLCSRQLPGAHEVSKGSTVWLESSVLDGASVSGDNTQPSGSERTQKTFQAVVEVATLLAITPVGPTETPMQEAKTCRAFIKSLKPL